MADALGEVCNMVAGNFKNKIAGLAEGGMLSPPLQSPAATMICNPCQAPRLLSSGYGLKDLPVVISVFLCRFKARSAPIQSRSGESREQTRLLAPRGQDATAFEANTADTKS